MKKKAVLLFLFLVVLLAPSCSFSNGVVGDAILVEWIPEDSYHDDKEFKDYTSFMYNGVYYKEIPTDGIHEDLVVFKSNYWSIDLSQMQILGKMKIRSTSSAYLPQEVDFLYQYHQVYAYPKDESKPNFIYCANHLWIRADISILSPIVSIPLQLF